MYEYHISKVKSTQGQKNINKTKQNEEKISTNIGAVGKY